MNFFLLFLHKFLMMTFDEIKRILKQKTIGIAGCGGLGSNCAVGLARVGIGTLIIADFDRVELSNLNRQYYFINQIGELKTDALKKNLMAINPEINIINHNVLLTENNIPHIFQKCDIIVEAFDKAEMKEMLIETILIEMTDKPIISGLGMAGWGKNSSISSRKASKNLYVCGDETSEISDDNPPLGPRVAIVANMQANLALELILGQH